MHQSWSQVASVFIFGFIPSVLHYVMVYTYYRQTTDPKHPANLQHNHPHLRESRVGGSSREAGYSQLGYSRVGANDGSSSSTGLLAVPHPSARLRTSARRSQAQNTRSQRGVSASSSSHNVEGSTAGTSKRTFASRGLQRSHRPPPLIQSPSPVGFTPGPPSYNNVNKRSRVYAAFAAPVPSDSDKSV